MSNVQHFRGFVASAQGAALESRVFAAAAPLPEEVQVRVQSCGVCHSDLSVIDNEWGNARYPFVPGHEIVGTISAVGSAVPPGLAIGQTVGIGWFSGACMVCNACTAGDHNLCVRGQATILGRNGGFAEQLSCHWRWATPIPEGVVLADAGPLFCGGITVFAPIVEFGVRPTDRVGVVGIGGLGHLAVRFLRAWGCDVTAFTSSAAKFEEAQRLGAHRAVDSRNSKAIAALKGQLDFVLVSANVKLDWNAYLAALAPRGRLHFVGAVLEPIPVSVFSLMGGRKSISSSPLGSPAVTAQMLKFCARHQIAPQVERFPLSEVNEALAHVRAGQARYRVVLDNDLS